MVHVRQLAHAPHPIGSGTNAAVREYVRAQLAALGLQPQIFSTIGVLQRGRAITAGNVQDIIARLPGANSSSAVMLMAHYDSVSRAPGAADDSAGVAAILETLRAVKSGAPLKNDIFVLITDGEEAGMLGAEAFVHSNPLMKSVGVVMNFEARGSQGPSLLFETSVNNGALIENVKKAAPYPTGSSLFYSLYKLLPNDTDFTLFRPSKIPGLNFAFGAGLEAYHTKFDSPENLSTASLQHHGSYALALTRHFGQMDLSQLQSSHGDEIFFNWFGNNLVTYPQSLAIWGEILATLLLGCVVLVFLRKSELRIGKLLLALLGCIAILLVIPAMLGVAGWIVARLLAGNLIASDAPANAYLLSGYILLGACAGSFVFAALQKKFEIRELSLAGLILLDIFSWILALQLPGASYLLFWPLLLMTLGLLALALKKEETPGARLLASLPGTAFTVLLFAPFIYLLYIFLTLQLPTILAAGVLLGIFFIACPPFISLAVPQLKWKAAVSLLLLVAIASLAVGATRSRRTAEHPRRDSILYSLNSDDHTARWISYDRSLDDWTKQFFTSTPPQRQPQPNYLGGSKAPVVSASAPLLEMLPPTIEIKQDEKTEDTHKLRLTVQSPRSAGAISLVFADDIQTSSVTVNGREIDVHNHAGGLGINLLGMGSTNVDLQLTLKAPSGISFWLMDQTSGLPLGEHSRPDNIIAGYGSDVTAVCRKYKL